jgi:hypothetical protein
LLSNENHCAPQRVAFEASHCPQPNKFHE